ncbi:4-(cytidine 5'-diphospho)-2-C-methyl-D-erythritol kinase [Mitsuokella sp.]|uniref:4-(cytidine 5'-diphospho)-2-C-methyl-D-erythritol kinase n=1 Tax=Mitsuokella sp. TaxID=2049034 RepID=UPI002A80DA47|nr:4-(cytidine 5'-diphospho)-2-C-methyl-D-erythritol kinase [Mitsuokella sp.]MDY4475659.1 4-(cytidine 5'-diphospho)-2-C-methyl-D-erythritol kinase [Mitsuokella sp.]
MITVNGEAKINLTLDILGKRPDGYHEVSMVMQSVSLHDTLQLERIPEGIELSIDVPWLEADETNLAYRAAAKILAYGRVSGGVRIQLQKRIPMAAGLAGGSADAAAVLRGVNELYGLNLSLDELCSLAAQLGSDIPFCLCGGTMLATGRGEVLKRLPPVPAFWVVLAKPPISVSTAWAYQHYDAEGAERHPDNEAMCRAIAAGSREELAPLLCNVLESVTIKQYPVIAVYKEKMLQQGAMVSMMSGSGPTVFGLLGTRAAAERLAAVLREQTDADVFVCHTTQED